MCHLRTPYYTLCKHWGSPEFTSAGPCIRALTQPGLSRGCWDTKSVGMRTVDALCPMCSQQGDILLSDFASDHGSDFVDTGKGIDVADDIGQEEKQEHAEETREDSVVERPPSKARDPAYSEKILTLAETVTTPPNGQHRNRKRDRSKARLQQALQHLYAVCKIRRE